MEKIVFCGGNLPNELSDYLSNIFNKQVESEMCRKFPISTRVKFIGTVYDLAECIGSARKTSDLDAAKSVFFDGATGNVLGSDFLQGQTYYVVDFGGGCHNYVVPEKFLKRG